MSRALRRCLFAGALLAALIVPTPARADGGWATKTCPGCPDTGWLAHVASPDGSRVVATGASAPVVLSSEAGEEWVAAETPFEHGVPALAYADTTHAWLAGPEGVAASVDGGATWTLVDDRPRYFADLAFADATHGWGVGPSGTILATSDGGRSWRLQRAGDEELVAVAFVDADRGWAVGARGRGDARRAVVLATDDGGEAWQPLRAPELAAAAELSGVEFADADHGWLIGRAADRDRGAILATSDGGATWSEQDCVACPPMRAVSFADARHGWAVGTSGAIRATVDGGAHWRPQPPPAAGGGLVDVVALSWERAVAVGPGPGLYVLTPPGGSVVNAAGGGLLVVGVMCGLGGIAALAALRRGRPVAAVLSSHRAAAAGLLVATVGGIAAGSAIAGRADCSMAKGVVVARVPLPAEGLAPDGCRFEALVHSVDQHPGELPERFTVDRDGTRPVVIDLPPGSLDGRAPPFVVRVVEASGGRAYVDGGHVVFEPAGAAPGEVRYEVGDLDGTTVQTTAVVP